MLPLCSFHGIVNHIYVITLIGSDKTLDSEGSFSLSKLHHPANLCRFNLLLELHRF